MSDPQRACAPAARPRREAAERGVINSDQAVSVCSPVWPYPMTMSLASRISVISVAAACVLAVRVGALDGQPGIHDPSTVMVENGKYYVYGTGAGLPMVTSDDGWTW